MKEQNPVVVVDALMGAGKTSWAIDYINGHEDENFVFITPFITETERIKNAVRREVKVPKVMDANGKLGNCLELLKNENDIATTHKLFTMLTDEHKEAIRQGEYTLFIDESLEAVCPYEMAKRDDIQYLLDKKSIEIAPDGCILWTDRDYDISYNHIKILSENHALFRVNGKILLWKYPSSIFGLFKKVYVLTYLFEASVMKYYFDLSGIRYELKSVEQEKDKYQLVDYFPPSTKHYQDLIHVYEHKDLNELFVQKKSALSANWYKSGNNKDKINLLKKRVYNYFRNKCNAKAEDILWTTFKSKRYTLRGKGYSNSFVSLGCRATNNYSDRHYLAYLANVYPHAGVSQYFAQKGYPIDQDQYALGELLQWVFRSAVRNGEDIHIYIPSKRMRTLFGEWLDEKR